MATSARLASHSISLVDIDAYDYRNQEQLKRLRGKADAAYIQRESVVSSHIRDIAFDVGNSAASWAAKHCRPGLGHYGRRPPHAGAGRFRADRNLPPIFRCKQGKTFCAENCRDDFPVKNDIARISKTLYETANWWPPNTSARTQNMAQTPAPRLAKRWTKTRPRPAHYTLRDLSKIRPKNFQQTPRAMLNTAVSEVGECVRVSRALAVIGAPGRPPNIGCEYLGKT